MFGQNRPRGNNDVKEGQLQVHEVFYTLQGEGPFSGYPAVFVRLSGCNLRCWFCDTKWDDDNDPYCYPEQIVANVKAIQGRARLVVITGGEPLRQDLTELCALLNAAGFMVQIETAGTYWQDICIMGKHVYTVVSPKNGRVHPKFKELHNAAGPTGVPLAVWKYVVQAGAVADDGLPIGNFQRLKNGSIGGGELERPPKGARVYLQPCDEYDEAKNKANLAAVAKSCLEHGYIGGVQVHKYLSLE